MNRILNNAEHWELRAQEARDQAEQIIDETAKREMLAIAKKYERMAKLADDRHLASD